jgi:predicted cation transporter
MLARRSDSSDATMNETAAAILLVLLLFGPLALNVIEHNIEIYFLVLGIAATLIGERFSLHLLRQALTEPLEISAAVLVAGLLFRWIGPRLDDAFGTLRGRFSRGALAAMSIFVIAMLASLITAIVAALVLVQVIGLLHLEHPKRPAVTVAACFAVGLGAALTPIGEPLSTLAAYALKLSFLGLFDLLAPWVVPGVIATALVAGYFARGDYAPVHDVIHEDQGLAQIIFQTLKVFAFVAGLVLISHAYASVATKYVAMLSNDALFWANMVSAALDNATLVALEVHQMPLDRAREAIISLLLSGGMLIPGNIPNIVSAGALKIDSGRWARIGVPIGIVLLGIYFAVLKMAG